MSACRLGSQACPHLARSPALATGFDLGFWADNRHFINNHLMFKILVYKTNGQYTKARKRYEEMEAASVVEVRRDCRPQFVCPCSNLDAHKMQLSGHAGRC